MKEEPTYRLTAKGKAIVSLMKTNDIDKISSILDDYKNTLLKELKEECVGEEVKCADCGCGYEDCHCAGNSDGYNEKRNQVESVFNKYDQK